MLDKPFFSIVIPTFNRTDLIERCLVRLLEQEIPNEIQFEILVGDDSSGVETKQCIAEKYPSVKWIEGPRKGPAANRNNAARHAKGVWLIFIDDDTEARPSFIKEYFQMAQTSEYLVLEGRIICPDKRNSPFYRMPENLNGNIFASGNIAFQRSTFNKLGGFDEELEVMEDLEIGHRIRTQKIPNNFCAGASVYHRAQRLDLGHLVWWAFHHRWSILFDYKVGAKSLNSTLPNAILHSIAKHILLLARTTWHLLTQHDPRTWKNRWFWQIWGWLSLPMTIPCLCLSEVRFRKLIINNSLSNPCSGRSYVKNN